MAHYELGNDHRGYITGVFDSDDEARITLTERFDAQFPSRFGREVEMRKTVTIWRGTTNGGNETEDDRRLREGIAAVVAQNV